MYFLYSLPFPSAWIWGGQEIVLISTLHQTHVLACHPLLVFFYGSCHARQSQLRWNAEKWTFQVMQLLTLSSHENFLTKPYTKVFEKGRSLKILLEAPRLEFSPKLGQCKARPSNFAGVCFLFLVYSTAPIHQCPGLNARGQRERKPLSGALATVNIYLQMWHAWYIFLLNSQKKNNCASLW